MSLKGSAQETLAIIERGTYPPPSGQVVPLREAIDHAVRGTRLYTPAELDTLVTARGASPPPPGPPPAVEVTTETTTAAARRLTTAGTANVVLLNFASAKNAGGGFLTGAKAQEEDLARGSALYPCLRTQPAYYAANRAQDSLLYTNHVIYSPDVPFFRDDGLALLETPFLASVISAPAPNAGEELRRHPDAGPRIQAVLETRAAMVLAVAAAHGHRTLVLGAWGCGVFRNDPRAVAEVFARHLTSPRFAGAFERSVFAVYDRSRSQSTFQAFAGRWGLA